MEKNNFQQRIDYQGNLVLVLLSVCKDYSFGDYISHKIVPMGYEDFNVILETNNGKYFVKFFASFRDKQSIERYITVTEAAVKAGVRHPKLYASTQDTLYTTEVDGVQIPLWVMEYIDGGSLYELKAKTSMEDAQFLAQQAAIINQIDLKPKPIYDSWAISSFPKEYNKAEQYLGDEEKALITPIFEEYLSTDHDKLPRTLTHADIINTNVLKDKEGKLYIIDFSVASYYQRICELAWLLCNLLFDEDSAERTREYYNLALSEYQKHITLTAEELKTLPLYVRTAHAMHFIRATGEKVLHDNTTDENEYWINLGWEGLKLGDYLTNIILPPPA